MNKQNELLAYEAKLQKKNKKEQKARDQYTIKRQQEISGYARGFGRNVPSSAKTPTIYKILTAIFFLTAVGLGSFTFFLQQKYESEVYYLEKALTKTSKEKDEALQKLELYKHDIANSGYISKTILSDAEKDQVILKDDFLGNPRKWFTKNDLNVELSIKKGGYYFSHKREKESWLSWNKANFQEESNFLIECTVKKESGVNNYGYGIVWGLLNAKNNYHFQISGDGSYTVRKFSGGKTFKIIPWRKSVHIVKYNSTNKLSIKKYDNILNFFINDKWVGSSPFEPFMGRNIGFKVDQKQAVVFKNLKITKLITRKSVFIENFKNNSNGWAEKNSADVLLSVNQGTYIFSHKRNNKSWLTWKKVTIDEKRDFLIESEMVKTGGVNNNGYGVVFGLKDASNCFFFQISGDGHYRFYKSFKGNYTHIIPWKKNKYVKKYNSGNKLSIKKVGNNLEFYINGNYVDKALFQNFMGTGVGFRIDMKQGMKIKNLIVSKI
jgi:hypothetical protein